MSKKFYCTGHIGNPYAYSQDKSSLETPIEKQNYLDTLHQAEEDVNSSRSFNCTSACQYYPNCQTKEFHKDKLCDDIDIENCRIRKFYDKYGGDYLK